MPQYWLVKTEPTVYSYADLVMEKKTVWSGVTNNAALKHMRSMKKGDLAFIYHTGDEKSVVGVAEVVKGPYADPAARDPKLVVIDLKPKEPLKNPVSLAAIKGHQQFADFALVRISRLSVLPVEKPVWDAIFRMSK